MVGRRLRAWRRKARSLVSPRSMARSVQSGSSRGTGVRVAEGAGLENRYTGNGIVGSNPTLSVRLEMVPMTFALLLQATSAIAPDDCVITGLCGVRPDQVGPGSGLMFLAIGFVALGGWSWWSAHRRPAPPTRP